MRVYDVVAMPRFLIAAQALLFAGCMLDPSGLSEDDTDTRDGGMDAAVDAGEVDPDTDAGFDAGFDAGAPIPGMDAGFDGGFDAGMIDAGMIDAGFDGGFDGGFDAGAPPSCGSIYGSTDGYELCSFDGMSCTFYYNPSGGSRARCREICGSSARCLGAFHDTDDSCGIGAATTCDDDEWDNICVCVRTP